MEYACWAYYFGVCAARGVDIRGLAHTFWRLTLKKVAANLGFRMTKQSFAKGAAKTIPVVGAVISGGLTFATFPPMAKRLQKHLAGLALAKPCGVPNTTDTGITPA